LSPRLAVYDPWTPVTSGQKHRYGLLFASWKFPFDELRLFKSFKAFLLDVEIVPIKAKLAHRLCRIWNQSEVPHSRASTV
jgi:hypothetical protein